MEFSDLKKKFHIAMTIQQMRRSGELNPPRSCKNHHFLDDFRYCGEDRTRNFQHRRDRERDRRSRQPGAVHPHIQTRDRAFVEWWTLRVARYPYGSAGAWLKQETIAPKLSGKIFLIENIKILFERKLFKRSLKLFQLFFKNLISYNFRNIVTRTI